MKPWINQLINMIRSHKERRLENLAVITHGLLYMLGIIFAVTWLFSQMTVFAVLTGLMIILALGTGAKFGDRGFRLL